MAAEKNGEFVEALAHLIGAQEADPTMREASVHIQNFSGTVPAGSIRERAEWALAQKGKWEKIFKDLEIYLREKLPVFIYDFSVVEDTFDARSKTVTIRLNPGIKIVPDRTVLLVWKTIMDNWSRIKRMEENKGWANNVWVKDTISAIGYYEIGLYDDYGDRIADYGGYRGTWPVFSYRYSSSFQVVAQHKYYSDGKFYEVVFYEVPLDKITETITPKIGRIYYKWDGIDYEYPVLTPDEWQEWLASQSEAGN
jgi:hypothetical protein